MPGIKFMSEVTYWKKWCLLLQHCPGGLCGIPAAARVQMVVPFLGCVGLFIVLK